MNQKTKIIADRLLYFNETTSPECKSKIQTLFCDSWERIPEEDQNKMNSLEFIIVKRIVDNSHSTLGITYLSPSGMSFIIWDPFRVPLERESQIYTLAHELAHVLLQHPQIGSSLVDREKEEEYIVTTAETEAKNQTLLKWHIRPSKNDEDLFDH